MEKRLIKLRKRYDVEKDNIKKNNIEKGSVEKSNDEKDDAHHDVQTDLECGRMYTQAVIRPHDYPITFAGGIILDFGLRRAASISVQVGYPHEYEIHQEFEWVPFWVTDLGVGGCDMYQSVGRGGYFRHKSLRIDVLPPYHCAARQREMVNIVTVGGL